SATFRAWASTSSTGGGRPGESLGCANIFPGGDPPSPTWLVEQDVAPPPSHPLRVVRRCRRGDPRPARTGDVPLEAAATVPARVLPCAEPDWPILAPICTWVTRCS